MPIIMLKTNEIFLNQEQNIEHVGICMAEHHMQFCCIAGALECPIVGVQNRGVRQQGLKGPATACDGVFQKHCDASKSHGMPAMDFPKCW